MARRGWGRRIGVGVGRTAAGAGRATGCRRMNRRGVFFRRVPDVAHTTCGEGRETQEKGKRAVMALRPTEYGSVGIPWM